MPRRTTSQRLTLFVATFILSACSPSPPMTETETDDARPNFLFLFADDQRTDTIGAWGNPYIETPSLDRLADAGFSFRANYNLGGHHGAVCQPSRVMVNTGMSYFRVPDDMSGARLLPELLGDQGYTTFGTGKWHNGRESWLRGFQNGTAIFFGGMSDHTQVPLQDRLPDGILGKDREDGFSSVLFADAVIDFLRGHTDDTPFYAYVAFTAPHDPRQPPLPHRDRYYENRPPLPANFAPQHPFLIGDPMVRDEQLAAWPRTEEVVSDQLAEYYGLITHMDEEVGRILDVLDETGHAENTYIIYAADHGLAMGSHGLLGKQSVYEHSQRAPLIVVGPDVPRGESRAFTYLLDIFPTVTALAGVENPEGIDGHDLSGIWLGERQSIRDAIFLAYRDVARSVRDDRFKLIRYPQIDRTQLFDLVVDPDELNDLSEDGSQADRLAQLTALLETWQARMGDEQPLIVESPQPGAIDLTGAERTVDQWQPDWIVEKYFERTP
jgi:arylsulfatase A-like enzyme|tara:strand:+ start:325 stop:1812 length:1488 start_codon:yes stop_codon:yes gene_type:complete